MELFYTIASHLRRRLRYLNDKISDETSGWGIHVRTTIDWQIDDLCEPYDSERNPLIRLARTGFVMKRIMDLHILVDEATATYGIHETPWLKNWRPILLKERNWRMEVFEKSLVVPGGLDALLKKHRCDALELLTLLAYDYQKYAENVYTPMETVVITEVYNGIVLHSDICVVSVPKWFIPRYEVTVRNGDHLWQNVNVSVMQVPGGSDAMCIYQTAIWSDLNHPNVARLLGACHVGFPTFFVYEETHSITDNILWRLSLWNLWEYDIREHSGTVSTGVDP